MVHCRRHQPCYSNDGWSFQRHRELRNLQFRRAIGYLLLPELHELSRHHLRRVRSVFGQLLRFWLGSVHWVWKSEQPEHLLIVVFPRRTSTSCAGTVSFTKCLDRCSGPLSSSDEDA